MPEGVGGAEGEMSREDFDEMSQNAVDTMHELADKAKLVGTEEVEGREAFHLQAADINRVEDLGAGLEDALAVVGGAGSKHGLQRLRGGGAPLLAADRP